MSKIVVVSQITGDHGPCADTRLYAGLAKAAYPNTVVKEIVINKKWGDYALCKEIDTLFTSLEKLTNDDFVIFLGADWHSQVLHKNFHYKSLLKNLGCHIVSIFQETFLSKRSKIGIGIVEEMKLAQESAIEISDICIFNHWPDYKYRIESQLSRPSLKKHIYYMPFVHSIANFKTVGSSNVEKKVVAIGSAKFLEGEALYFSRALAVKQIRNDPNIHLIEKTDYLDAIQYYSTLKRYKYHLVLPSITSGLTARQVETCACGTIPIIPKPFSHVERQIYQNGINCFYYNPFSDISTQVSQILNSTDSIQYEQIRDNALNTASSYSTSNMANYFGDILSSIKTSQFKSSLKNALGTNLVFEDSASSKYDWKIGIDLVFFQLADTGIAKVWEDLLNYLAQTSLRDRILLIKRKGSKIPDSLNQYKIIETERYDETKSLRDMHMLDMLAEQYELSVFVSTYMTFTSIAYNISMIHDCIPERVCKGILSEVDKGWQNKINTINQSDMLITISDYSAKELQRFYPSTKLKPLIVAKNTLRQDFIDDLGKEQQNQHVIKNQCLLVGTRQGWNGYKNGRAAIEGISYFCQYFENIELLCVGGEHLDDGSYSSRFDIENELCEAIDIIKFKRIRPNDEELRELYIQSICLLFLSEDEGFGLPLYECLLSGGRVIALEKPWNSHITHPNLIKISSLDKSEIANAINNFKRNQLDPINSDIISANKKLRSAMSIEKYSQGKLLHEILELALISNCENFSDIKSELILFSNQFKSRSDLAKYMINRHPANVNAQSKQITKGRIAMLTSLYKAEQFVDQIINNIDCIHQMCEKDIDSSIEHIVIDSSSPSNEAKIFREKWENGNIEVPFIYYRTPYRESLYKAWNRSILLSRSEYLSNANADDTHSAYFAITACGFLNSNPEVMLAYPDQVIETNNDTPYGKSISTRVWGWPEYSYSQLLIGNHVGSTPVWRRKVHDEIGLFDSSFTCAGDWEFWLRIATYCGKLGKISIPISQYYFNPVGIEHGDPLTSYRECKDIQKKYATFGSYEISEKDIIQSNNSDATRSLDDMQYNGVDHKVIRIYIVNSMNNYILQGINSIHDGRTFPQIFVVEKGDFCVTSDVLMQHGEVSTKSQEVQFYIESDFVKVTLAPGFRDFCRDTFGKPDEKLLSYCPETLGSFSLIGLAKSCDTRSILNKIITLLI